MHMLSTALLLLRARHPQSDAHGSERPRYRQLSGFGLFYTFHAAVSIWQHAGEFGRNVDPCSHYFESILMPTQV